jgi:hypothetical protein
LLLNRKANSHTPVLLHALVSSTLEALMTLLFASRDKVKGLSFAMKMQPQRMHLNISTSS